jgi:hypothetical protein
MKRKTLRGFGTGKGRQPGTVNRLKKVQQIALAENVLCTITPLELKYMMVMETDKFMALMKLWVVRRAIELHGYTLKGFIRRHADSNENVRMFDEALKQVIASPKGKRYQRTGVMK